MSSQRPVITRPIEPSDRFYARTFAIFVVLGLGYLVLRILLPFLDSIAWSLFIAFLLHPLHVQLTRRLRGREQLSALLLTIITLVVLIGPLTALSAAFAAQAGDLIQSTKALIASSSSANVTDLNQWPVVARVAAWLHNTFDINETQIHTWVIDGGRSLAQLLAALGGRVFLGAIGTIVGFGLTMFMLYFFIRDGVEMLNNLRALIPMNHTYKDRLFEHLATVTRAVVFGTVMTAVIQGTLVGVAFLMIGLPSPIVFGVLAALAALLPFAGAALVWVPATLVLMAEQRWGAMVFMILWGVLVVSLVDNIVRPLLVSGRARVGTLTVFIGVLGGVAAFGAIGLVMGPTLVALALALLKFMRELRQQEQERRRNPGVSVTPQAPQ